MRKRSNRIPRPLAKLLTPTQHAELMLAPRLHLEQILQQCLDRYYFQSVAGVFNIVGGLAHQHGNRPLQANVDAAQEVLLALIKEHRPLSAEESEFLRQVFNQADHYIGLQNTLSLAKAIRMTDREIAAGRAAPIAYEGASDSSVGGA